MAELSALVAAALAAERGPMVALLADLVAIPTENPPGREYPAAVDRLARAMGDLELGVERIEHAGGRTVLVAVAAGAGPILYFHGHYDVVPGAPEQFVPRLEGDTMFGRGTSDMKSGIVAMLFAAKAVRDLRIASGGRVGVVLVPDEETGGTGGSAALAASGRLGVDGIGMLLAEPTSGVVWNANRGAISLQVTVRGRAAHVGLAHTGVNAFERALPVVAGLLEIKKALADGSILLVGGRVEAGTNFNVVPAECRFTIDRRLNPGENHYAERQRLLAVFEQARAQGVELELELLQEGRASWTAPDAPVARALAASIAEVTGRGAAFEMCPGLLETRFYGNVGVPAVAYGPGILAVSHGPQEFVRISRMIECAAIYALTAARLLGSRTTELDHPNLDTSR